MNIVFIENENINRNSSGGIMSYIINLSTWLRDQEITSHFIACGTKTNFKENLFSSFDSLNDDDQTISNFRFFFKLLTTNKLKSLNSNDIIHVQRPEMVLPLKLRLKNKIICTLHGGQDLAIKKKKGHFYYLFYFIIQSISFLVVSQIIVVDETNLSRYKKIYPWLKHKFSLIPISINTRNFYPMNKSEIRLSKGFFCSEKILLFIGRLEYEKNVSSIMDCFTNLNLINYKLLIVGSGSLKSELKNKTKNNNDIIFLDEIDNKEIPKIINMSDAFILSSYFEGSPTVVKEALCCNVPVISTDVGDVKEVLNLVDGGEIITFTNKNFLNALKNIETKECEFYKKAHDLFGLEFMGNKTLQVYNLL